jgi:hypothetical protein
MRARPRIRPRRRRGGGAQRLGATDIEQAYKLPISRGPDATGRNWGLRSGDRAV